MSTRDLRWAAAMFLSALGLYWMTLAPGLIGVTDTPKLQFVGAILGVPHPPGYPLYVLVSYAFSHLPIGTLAYRINFMSAFFGAVTVTLVFLCARRCGGSRFVSAVVALGLGGGQLFWSTAVLAEVYTLHTSLLSGVLLALMTWADTRSPRAYYAAVTCATLGIAHHTTILLLAPVFALYVLLVDPGFVLRVRRLAATFTIVALGFAPYLFIAVRTAQDAPFRETSISSLSDGVAAVFGQRWQEAVWAFDLPTLLGERVPMATSLLVRELSWPGLVAAGLGFALMIGRHRALASLLGLVWLVTVVLVLNYDITEIAVFMLPATLVAWLATTMLLADVEPRVTRFGSAVAAGAVGVLLVWAGWHLQRGYSASDRSREFHEIRRFEAVFETLPDRSVIASHDYLVNSMVRYKLFGEQAAGDRDIRLITGGGPARLASLHADGYAVFAFRRSARRLRFEGFSFAEVPLFEPGDALPRISLDQRRTGFGMGHIRNMQLYRLLDPGRCERLRPGRWVDITDLAAGGKLAVTLAAGAAVEVYVGRGTPLAPRLTAAGSGGRPRLDVQLLRPDAPGWDAARRDLEQVGLTAAVGEMMVRRLVLEGRQGSEAMLVLGGVPDFAVARSVAQDARARLCSATLGYDGLFGDVTRHTERIDWQRAGERELLGHGWTQVPGERQPWTTATAELLLPVWREGPGPLGLSLTAYRSETLRDDDLGEIQLEFNGRVLVRHPIRPGTAVYDWEVPVGILRVGLNQAYVRVTPADTTVGADRPLGVRVSDIALVL